MLRVRQTVLARRHHAQPEPLDRPDLQAQVPATASAHAGSAREHAWHRCRRLRRLDLGRYGRGSSLRRLLRGGRSPLSIPHCGRARGIVCGHFGRSFRVRRTHSATARFSCLALALRPVWTSTWISLWSFRPFLVPRTHSANPAFHASPWRCALCGQTRAMGCGDFGRSFRAFLELVVPQLVFSCPALAMAFALSFEMPPPV
mmetsp:Transcript_86670/g.248650  ORF Transcript_86670/g.248650 Transcript_86670/m.248650 type:complete len:202 (+) Transcript_86670:1064-1669(+)